jgi:hypothetical protein
LIKNILNNPIKANILLTSIKLHENLIIMKSETNIRNLKYLSVVLFIALLSYSCEFQPSEKYIVTLSPPTEAPELEFRLNLMTDTIFFYWESPITLTMRIENFRLLAIKCFLDNAEVQGNFNDTMAFVTLNFSEPGIHSFKMKIVMSSGTNSIADRIGAEGYQYETQEWTLVASSLNTDYNLSAKVVENELLLTWKDCAGNDFSSYRIEELSTGNVFNVQDTFLIDHTYIGQQAIYKLFVVDKFGNEYLWGNCHVNKGLPVLKLSNINNKVALTWNQSIFKDNIEGYQVFQGDWYYHWQNIGTLSANDTMIMLEREDSSNNFAMRAAFYLYCIPKTYTKMDNISVFYSYLQDAYIVLSGPKFLNHYAINCSGFYFTAYSSDYAKSILYKYDVTQDRVDVVMYDCIFNSISPNGVYLLNPHDSILDLYDLKNSEIVNSVNIKVIAKNFYPAIYPRISDNGICVFNSENVLYVFDIVDNRLISADSMSNNFGIKISPDGQYFSLHSSDSLIFYRINTNSIDRLTVFRNSSGSFYWDSYDFCPDRPGYFYIYQAPFIDIKSIADASIISHVNIGSDYFFNIDFCSGKILTAVDATSWHIYDLNTGSILQTIYSEIGSGAQNYTLLCNNTIYFTGHKFYLNK